ncbi:MAG TPA: AAA family ATPase [Malonomonas sp.]
MPKIHLALLLLLLFSTAPVRAEQDLHYTVQVATFLSQQRAENALEALSKQLPTVRSLSSRIEQIEQFYPLRVGRYQEMSSAQDILGEIQKLYPDSTVIRASWLPERIARQLQGVSGEELSDQVTAPVEVEKVAESVFVKTEPLIPSQVETSSVAFAAAVPTDPPQSTSKSAVESAPSSVKSSVLAPLQPSLEFDFAWWGAVLLAVILAIALLRLLFRSGGNRGDSLLLAAGHEHNPDIPTLPKDWELRLQKNQRELSAAEGNLLSAGENKKTFYLSSCFHGEGKTTAAVNLAYGLAEVSNKKILLVDGNSHSPQLHLLFGVPLSPGLTDLCTNQQRFSEVVRQTAYANLSLLTLGDIQSPPEHIACQSGLLQDQQLRAQFDYILIDGDSALGSSRVPLLAKSVDGILLAVTCEKTKFEVVQQVKERLTQVGGHVVGVLLNKRKYYIPRFFYGRK